MTDTLGRMRAVHPESGSVLVGEVVRRTAAGDVAVIPDGLLEQVLLRNGPWVIVEAAQDDPTRVQPSVHAFAVTVTGCSKEQAEQVMAERIACDEDYGFDYGIDWAAVSPAGGAS